MYCIKTLFKDTSPVNGALISTGGVYNVKNYKRYKEKEDYLQIGVTPDVMVKRTSYNLFQIYIVLELSFKLVKLVLDWMKVLTASLQVGFYYKWERAFRLFLRHFLASKLPH